MRESHCNHEPIRSSAGGRAVPAVAKPVATYKSIMEAYSAVGPGTVIKLAAGRHMISHVDGEEEERWPGLRFRKSVQIVAEDGLSPEQVLIGVDDGEDIDFFDDEGCVLPIYGAVRFSQVTFLCTRRLDFGLAFLTVQKGGQLWLEDCALKLAGDASLDPENAENGATRSKGVLREHRAGMGIKVEEGGSTVIRKCTIADADGPAVEVHPLAGRVLIEQSVINGCGQGSEEKADRGYFYRGERGAVELLVPSQLPVTSHKPTCEIILRECLIEGNYGPGVSWRPLPVERYKDASYHTCGGKQIDGVFTLQGCSTKGNCSGNTSRLAPWSGVSTTELAVCNVSRRGENGDDEEFEEESEDEDEYGEDGEEESDDYGDDDEDGEDGEEDDDEDDSVSG